jgi:outer membrane protein
VNVRPSENPTTSRSSPLRLLAFALAAAVAVPVAAAPRCAAVDAARLDLWAAVDRALCLSPDRAVANAAAAQADAAVGIERAGLLPSVSASASGTQSWSRAGAADSTTQQASAGLSASWRLLDFGATRSRVAQREQERRAALLAAGSTASSVALEAVGAWIDVVEAQDAVTAAQQAERSSEAALSAATARFEAGAGSQVDVLRARSTAAQSSLDRQLAAMALSRKRGRLALLLDLPLDAGIAPATALEPDDGSADASVESLIQAAVRDHPDVQAERARTAAATNALSAERAAWLPRLDLSGSFGPSWTRSDPALTTDGRGASGQVGLTLSVPLFDGGERRSKVAKAEAALASAQATVDAQIRATTRAVWQEWTDWHDARATLTASGVVLQSAVASEEATRGKYESGAGTLVDVLSAQADLASRRKQELQARNDLLRARFRLAQALGRLAAPSTSR